MRKLVGLVGLALLCVGLAPAPALAEDATVWQMRQTYRAARELVETFSLAECEFCAADEQNRQSRGATGSWNDQDYRCNKLVEVAAAFASMWSAGTNLAADLIAAYCAAADLVVELRPALDEWREGPYDLRDRIAREKYDQMTGPQKQIMWQIVGVHANVVVGYAITLPPPSPCVIYGSGC